MTLVVAALGCAIGVVFGDAGALTSDPSNPVVPGFVALGLLLAVLTRRWVLVSLVFVGLSAASAGLLRYDRRADDLNRADVLVYTQRGVVPLRGLIVSEPSVRGSGTSVDVDVREREAAGSWVASSGLVQVRTLAPVPVRVGDLVEVDGVLKPSDGDPSRPAESLLRRQGVVAIVQATGAHPDALRIIRPDAGTSITDRIARWRQGAAEALNRALPEPEAGLARSFSLGERSTLVPSLANAFQRTNTSHILAVDGYKVGLVVTFLEATLVHLAGDAVAVTGTIVGVALYAVFVGASPSAIRAAIMGGVFCVGRYLGRPSDVLVALAAAGLAMMLVDPFILWDVGFQLSFLTTLGMATLAPVFDAWLPIRWNWLREVTGTTLAAELASAPLTIGAFAQLSLVSLPVHAVVMPMLPVAVAGSFATAVAGSINPTMGYLVGLVAWLPLAAIATIVGMAGRLSAAAVPAPGGPGSPAALVAAALDLSLGVAILSRPNPLSGRSLIPSTFWGRVGAVAWGSPRRRFLVVGALLSIAFGAALALSRATPPDRVDFLDVTGDAALVEVGGRGAAYLHDGGSATRIAQVAEPLLPVWDRSIGVAVLSEGDDAALANLYDVSQRLTLRRVVEPTGGISSVYRQRWADLAAATGIQRIPGRTGMDVQLSDDASFVVYATPARQAQGRASASPPRLAVRLTIGSAHVVWVSADPTDQAMLAAARLPLRANVLKLFGQQSRWGVDQAFFQAVNPSIVVLSNGAASRFAQETPGTTDLLDGRRVLRTDQDGTIRISFTQTGMVVETER